MENKDSLELKEEINAVDEMIEDLFSKRLRLAQKRQQAIKQENYVLTLEQSEASDQQISPFGKKFIQNMDQLESSFLNSLEGNTNSFLKDTADFAEFKDAIFSVRTLCKQDNSPEKINAIPGYLIDDEGKIVSFKTVYDSYNSLPDSIKAGYAEDSFGNRDYTEAIFQWINQNNNINLPHKVVATAGGTGALSLCFSQFLNSNETILIPKVCWSSYQLMAKENNLKIATYKHLDDNGKADLTDLMLQSLKVIKQQGKLVVVINDPCHNPTGISYGSDNWKILIELFKKLTEYGKVIIINDVAYIDYAYSNRYESFRHFNDMNQDMVAVICYSCSKSFTGYGQRLGAAIILSKQQELVNQIYHCFGKASRALWSNVNNGFMKAVSDVIINHTEEISAELKYYKELLKARSNSFIQAAEACELPIYPYQEGFFVFIKEEDKQIREKAHQYLVDKHIYTVCFEGGIRVALCSIPEKQCAVLPALIKQALEVSKND